MLTLSLLGQQVGLGPLVKCFKSKNGHFCIYLGERDASFSANCDILRALLQICDDINYEKDRSNLLDFLCELWWRGAIEDKWVS